MQRNGQFSGCGLLIVLVLAAAVIQYVGAIIGIGAIIAASYMRRNGPWQDRVGHLKANVMIGVGIALCLAQAAMIYGKYTDAHPAEEKEAVVATGPIPQRFWGTWATDLPSCNSSYTMNINSERVALSSMSLFADKVSTPDANTLIISGTAAGSGGGDVTLQDETQTLTLSSDGNTFTMGEYVHVRCPS